MANSAHLLRPAYLAETGLIPLRKRGLMMSISTALALVDPSHGKSTLRAAGLAADRIGASVRALVVRPPISLPDLPSTPYAHLIPPEVMQRVRETAEQEAGRAVVAATNVFRSWDGAERAELIERSGDVPDVVGRESRVYGLTVLPCGDLKEADSPAISAALFASGQPVLIAPLQEVATLGSRVAVFWKDGPQAARAVWSALPFLRQADSVAAFTVDDGENAASSLSRLKDGLGFAGVDIETQLILPDNRDASENLIDHAADIDADLVVMGAYSHSRLREMVLGGVTRNALMTLARPTLMAH